MNKRNQTESFMALPKFRFHLSTAILLMFAAGGLIGLNVQRRFVSTAVLRNFDWEYEDGEFRFGFPVGAFIEKVKLSFDTGDNRRRFTKSNLNFLTQQGFVNSEAFGGNGIIHKKVNAGEFILIGIVIDCLFGLTILLIIGLVSEYIIHRRMNHSAFSTQDSALPL